MKSSTDFLKLSLLQGRISSIAPGAALTQEVGSLFCVMFTFNYSGPKLCMKFYCVRNSTLA